MNIKTFQAEKRADILDGKNICTLLCIYFCICTIYCLVVWCWCIKGDILACIHYISTTLLDRLRSSLTAQRWEITTHKSLEGYKRHKMIFHECICNSVRDFFSFKKNLHVMVSSRSNAYSSSDSVAFLSAIFVVIWVLVVVRDKSVLTFLFHFNIYFSQENKIFQIF